MNWIASHHPASNSNVEETLHRLDVKVGDNPSFLVIWLYQDMSKKQNKYWFHITEPTKVVSEPFYAASVEKARLLALDRATLEVSRYYAQIMELLSNVGMARTEQEKACGRQKEV